MSSRTEWTGGRAALHGWAVCIACLTFALLCSGGLVTSHDAGMAVPDWPNTFGYNMFLFPFSRWVGGIFFEHTHRLIASTVGLCVAILAACLWGYETKGPARWMGIGGVAAVLVGLGTLAVILAQLGVQRNPIILSLATFAIFLIIFSLWQFSQNRTAYRWLGLAAFWAVILQGILGGLRVVLIQDHIGILHALLAQTFFVGISLLAVTLSRPFLEKRWADFAPHLTLRRCAFVATGLIFFQLLLGATMRHEHIGLSIPDFPLAYGHLLPDTSPEAMAAINAQRVAENLKPASVFQIWVQMVHRFNAGLIFIMVFACAILARDAARSIRGRAWLWLGMICAQIGLGAWTIWSNKAADVATAHLALGALSLLMGALLSFRLICGARRQDFIAPDVPDRHLVEHAA